MISGIISTINKCNKKAIDTKETVATVETVVFNILEDPRYSIRKNKLYFDEEALVGMEVVNLAVKNLDRLSENDCVFLNTIWTYFYFSGFDLRNKTKFQFDIKELYRYVDEQLSLGVHNTALKLKELEYYLGVLDQDKVFKLIEIEEVDGFHHIDLSYISNMLNRELFKINRDLL